MRRIIVLLSTLLITLGVIGGLVIANQHSSVSAAGSLGKVTVDTNVSQWNVGSGQKNGEFVVID
jgi:hypothetical protein